MGIWTGDLIDDKESPKSFESRDDFEQRIFGGISGSSSASESFFQKLDRLSKARNFTNSGPDKRYGSEVWNDLDGEEEYDGKGDAEGMDDFDDMDEYDEMDESFDSLSDGMDEKLKKAATYYKVDPEEMEEEDYEYRPDMRFPIGSTYDIKVCNIVVATESVLKELLFGCIGSSMFLKALAFLSLGHFMCPVHSANILCRN